MSAQYILNRQPCRMMSRQLRLEMREIARLMSATSTLPDSKVDTRVGERTLLWAIALCSFSSLLLELALTRLFSVVLFYHFAFLSISIALLGLGAGGVFAYLRRDWLLRWDTRALGAWLSFSCALGVLVVLEVVLHSQVNLTLGQRDIGALTLLYLSSAVPFFLVGLLFSVVFARHAETIARLYGADLLGGALACLATVPLLNTLGAPNAILASAITLAIASIVWSVKSRQRLAGTVLAISLLVLIIGNCFHPFIDIIYAKGKRRTGVEYARWNAISRVEVDRNPDGARYVVIDADASTAIMGIDPHHLSSQGWEAALMSTPASVANVLRPHGEYAIIGPGGGVDVLRAVANGSPKVTGIEINPIIVNDIMRGRYAEFSHHLYQIPEVNIHVEDGRSFIRSSRDRYDVLQMTLVDTWASTAAGAFALSENNLYTVQAFKEYFLHLKPDGMIAITRWEFREPREAVRVVSVAMDALHQQGVTNPDANFLVISDGPLNTDGRPVLVLAKRTPFTAEEQAIVRDDLRVHPNLAAQYVPWQAEENVFSRLIRSNDPFSFARGYKFNVAPVSDNAPFFFFTLKIGQLVSQGVAHGIDWKVNVGVAVLGLVLLLSIAAVLAFLVLPLVFGTKNSHGKTLPLLYFVAIGLGYILVEITFIQRFVLFLGHPTYALTVVIFLMLVSSGAGSLVSRRWLRGRNLARSPLLAIVAGLLAYVFLLPAVLPSMVGFPFALKLIISGLLLTPLGFLMGMPFPAGLGALGAAAASNPTTAETPGESGVEWAWAMNAASSVLGSVLAMVIAIRFGLSATLMTGAVAYLLAVTLTPALLKLRAT
jgi:spermidine synthase